jgi:hypothetical protein
MTEGFDAVYWSGGIAIAMTIILLDLLNCAFSLPLCAQCLLSMLSVVKKSSLTTKFTYPINQR